MHDIDSNEVLVKSWADRLLCVRRVKSLPAIRPARS